jgi:16S rRNA (adenine1518-N6/adenine1519-N6)-dimethyltransferase
MGHGLLSLASSGQYCLDYPVSLSKLDVPGLLRQYGLHPKKSLGQNFLLDDSALQLIINTAQISPDEVVLEIGSGLGSLTRYLALHSRSVIAVELDHNLIPPLVQVVEQYPNVRVVQGDILALDPVMLVDQQDYAVVANIPYYITSALMRHLLEARIPPRRIVLTLQREVAKRICAAPGDMSLLALSVQVYGHPEVIAHIPAGAFYPPPKVDSSVLRIDLFTTPLIPIHELNEFFKLIKAGFSQKRKTMRNAISGGLRINPTEVEALLIASDIDPMRRAETLDITEWHRLTIKFIDQVHPSAD